MTEAQEPDWESRPRLPPFHLSGFVFPRDIGGIIIRLVCSTWNVVHPDDCGDLVAEWNHRIIESEKLHEFHTLSARSVCKTWYELTPPISGKSHNMCSSIVKAVFSNQTSSWCPIEQLKFLAKLNYPVTHECGDYISVAQYAFWRKDWCFLEFILNDSNLERIDTAMFNEIMKMSNREQKLHYCKVIFKRRIHPWNENGDALPFRETFLQYPDIDIFNLLMKHMDCVGSDFKFLLYLAFKWPTHQCVNQLRYHIRFFSESETIMFAAFKYCSDPERIIYVLKWLRNVELPPDRSYNLDNPFDASFDWQKMLDLLIPWMGSIKIEEWAHQAIRHDQCSLAAHLFHALNRKRPHEKIYVDRDLCERLSTESGYKSRALKQKQVW